MDIIKQPGFVRFTLSDEELTLPTWRAFIEDIKRMIPSEERSYNPRTYEWSVTEEWWPTVQELRKKHFTDENQIELL